MSRKMKTVSLVSAKMHRRGIKARFSRKIGRMTRRARASKTKLR